MALKISLEGVARIRDGTKKTVPMRKKKGNYKLLLKHKVKTEIIIMTQPI